MRYTRKKRSKTLPFLWVNSICITKRPNKHKSFFFTSRRQAGRMKKEKNGAKKRSAMIGQKFSLSSYILCVFRWPDVRSFGLKELHTFLTCLWLSRGNDKKGLHLLTLQRPSSSRQLFPTTTTNGLFSSSSDRRRKRERERASSN